MFCAALIGGAAMAVDVRCLLYRHGQHRLAHGCPARRPTALTGHDDGQDTGPTSLGGHDGRRAADSGDDTGTTQPTTGVRGAGVTR